MPYRNSRHHANPRHPYASPFVLLEHAAVRSKTRPAQGSIDALKYRAVTNPTLEALAYWAIIVTEWAIGLLCLAGAWRLFATRRDRRAFNAAKPIAACGLVLLFLLYFVGFVMIGGEWFSMWQSQVWNGQAKSVMFLTCGMLVLIVLWLPEESDTP